ncbi:Serine/threonine-protein phosphatase 2A activator [Allomyces javanicus]|nr:Serine/threonine-protein phosphatase 2A activator [Allomyces javanicus]
MTSYPRHIPTAGGTPVHPSLLPKVGGAAPSHYPIANLHRQHVDLEEPGPDPERRILAHDDVARWLHSEAFVRLLAFVQAVSHASVGKSCTGARTELEEAGEEAHPPIRTLLALLDTFDRWIDETPPEPQRARFGNKAFRTWMERLNTELPSLVDPFPSVARRDLIAYLSDSFGNATRLDYGSGHELAFVCFLTCLDVVRFFADDDLSYIAVVVFARYLKVVRRIQETYTLEPAGSHGVWGLDDFQFVSYYWGSAQLIDHEHLTPRCITKKDVVSHFARDYMYLACIDFIYKMKQGPFFEHSPMLYDISGVPLWSKVNSGLLKMYIAEVLSKFPIVQHMKFGELLPFRPVDALTV